MDKQEQTQDVQEEQMGQEFAYELKIPEERIAILIGTDGTTKKQIEDQSGCKLDITKDGDVTVSGEDGIILFTAKEIVRAVARGFNPNTALLLLKPDYALEMVELKDIAGKNKNEMARYKSRIIGKGGRAREEIERLTDTYISVYGKTVGIIGEVSQAALARQAIGMLIDGSMHRTVYKFLEKKKKDRLFG